MIHIRNLVKNYQDLEGQTIHVLNIPTFELSEGQQIALEGLSGSGKSTLLNIIAGMLTPTAGEVFVAGRDMAQLKEAERDLWRAKHIGYVFQTFNLLQGYTVLENVILAQAFGCGVNETFAKHLLDQVGLSKYSHRLPRQLSTGQQQRVAVARALANKPQVVLADEPTGSLDAVHASQVIGLIQHICRENKAALLLVSHDQQILRKFTKAMTLSSINKV